ncbi:MAG: insulinase family protein [Bacteroidales bacterium]|nr:insulinase family protein [Bacteroidales bacterium]
MKRIFSFIVALGFGLGVVASAQQMPPIPVDPNVKIGKLDNGLTYYIRHNEEPKGQANFYIAQKVGSILEDESQRGLAHFLEHMCFNGTEHFPGNGVVKYCESIGVKFGADLNAYTSIDETVYNIDNVPVGKVPSAIDSCLWILHDWADGLLLNPADIDGERGVIHEEWRSRQNAQMRIYEKILPEIYPNHNKYGERLPIGLMEVVDNFPYQVLRDYYEKWYRPDNQGIVVVGDIDVNEVEAKIKDIFGTIATPVNPAERYYVQVEDNDETIVSMAADKEFPYAQTFLFWKHDAYPMEMKGDMNYLVYQYAMGMTSMMLNERLKEFTQLPEPPFMMAQFGSDENFFLAKTKKSYMGIIVSGEDQLKNAVATVWREILRAKRGGFTASEYERARSEYMSQVESQYNAREKKNSASYCSEYVRHFIDAEPIMGIENEYALSQQLCPNIPVEVINQLFGQLVEEGKNLVVACMLPEKEGVSYPTVDEMKKMLADVAAENIEPYQEEVSNEPLLAQIPTGGKIVKTKADKFGYTMYKLSNGATVYVKPTDFNKDQIVLRAFSEGGMSLYPESEALSLNNVSLFKEGGVGNFSSTALTKALAGKQVGVNPYINLYEEGMRGNSTPKDFETMLQLVYLYFTAHRTDEDAFKSWQNKTRAQLLNAEKQPMTALQDTLSRALYNNNPRAMVMKAADVDKVDYARIMQIAKERFANAADFTFLFTGAVDEETMLPLIAQYIGSLPAQGKKEKAREVGMNFTKGMQDKVFAKDMEVPMAVVVYMETGKGKNDLKNDLALDIAHQVLDIIYTEEIREKEGGTYGVSTAGGLNQRPKETDAYLQIIYQTSPEAYERLNARIEELLGEFVQNGPSEANMKKVKDYMHKTYQENLRQNGYWSGEMYFWKKYGIDEVTDYEKVLDSITTEDVRKAIDNILKQRNQTRVIMYGETK